ncbi:MAG TPA: HlyD family efflux transporter periplasmic adaptor subunit [Coxiellaceae bacterium]|nr:HlyD family efflux transporter periplasmic adaptor subunit [Coxiellaceae bacterium]
MRWMIVCACLFLSACSHHHSDYYLGYVEGKYIYLSSPVSGQLTTLLVRQGETVTENQPAFQLDPEPEQSQLAAAKAELNIATHDLDNLKLGQRDTIIKSLEAQILRVQANLVFSKKMFDRNTLLQKTGAIGQATFDQSRAKYESDLQELKVTEANLAEAKLGARKYLILAQESKVKSASDRVMECEWRLAQKTKRIPKAGFIQETFYREHEFVPAGKPILSLLPPGNHVVVFFVPEKELNRVKLGKKITFTCDECNKTLSGKISYISSRAEYTPPVIYSRESRSKLVYWIEAAIDADSVKQVNPGEPVNVSVSVSKG